MRVLLLGGVGYIGYQVARVLLKSRFDVTIIDHKLDVCDLDLSAFTCHNSVQKLLEVSREPVQSVWVINCAGYPTKNVNEQNYQDSVNSNLIITLQDIKNIHSRFLISKYTYLSSVYADSPSGSYYGAIKYATENFLFQFCKTADIPLQILRIGSVIGGKRDKNSTLADLVVQIKRGTFVEADLRASRDYIFVNSLANEISKFYRYDNGYFRLKGDNKFTIKELISGAISYFGKLENEFHIKQKDQKVGYIQNISDNDPPVEEIKIKNCLKLSDIIETVDPE